MPYTAINARKQLKTSGANPADYGIASWDQANYQILANALGDEVVKDSYFYVGVSDAAKANRVLAHPGGSTDPVTKQVLTQEKTQQAASSYTKDNAIAEVQAAAKQYYNSLYSPFYSTALTPSGRQQAQATLDTTIKNVFAKAQQYGVSADEFNSIFSNTISSEQTSQIQQYEKLNADRGGLLGFLDKATPIVTSIAAAVITGGLTLPEQIAANSLIQLSQGANPADIIRNVIATIGANAVTNGIPGVESSKEIPNVLNKINKAIAGAGPNIVSPTVISGLINAERQAIAALITKQDVGTNALAGFAGGSIADLSGLTIKSISPKMSNALSQALSRSIAEYAQYRTAGFTNEQALIKATEGYIDQSLQIERAAKKIESAAQKEKQLTSGLSEEQVGLSKTYGQGYIQTAAFDAGQSGQYTGTESGAEKLPEVIVYGSGYTSDTAAPSNISVIPGQYKTSAFESRTPTLPERIVYGNKYVDESAAPEDLSETSTSQFLTDDTTEQSTQEKTPEQLRRDTILTSLINKKFDRTLINIPTKKQPTTKTKTTQGGLGTSALAQALRVGDIGAPIFGRDEEGRRAGWNLQSLRYMGDVGAEND